MRVDVSGLKVARGGRTVVDNVNLTVESGQLVGLLGPNGSGKSTILRVGYRSLKPQAGEFLVGGENVWNLSQRQVAQRIAVMTQDRTDEFGITVSESVLLGRTPHHRGFSSDTDEDRHIAEDAMHKVGVSHFAERQVQELSGGERQRVLLARAIAQQAQVLVLDEPTNHLDIAYRFELMQIIKELGITTIIAMHELDLAMASCDAVAILVDGTIVSSGQPRDVLTAELLREVFRIDSVVVNHPYLGTEHILFTGASTRAPIATN